MKRRVGAKAEIFQAFDIWSKSVVKIADHARAERRDRKHVFDRRVPRIHTLARNEWAVLAPRAADATRRRAVSDLEVKPIHAKLSKIEPDIMIALFVIELPNREY